MCLSNHPSEFWFVRFPLKTNWRPFFTKRCDHLLFAHVWKSSRVKDTTNVFQIFPSYSKVLWNVAHQLQFYNFIWRVFVLSEWSHLTHDGHAKKHQCCHRSRWEKCQTDEQNLWDKDILFSAGLMLPSVLIWNLRTCSSNSAYQF